MTETPSYQSERLRQLALSADRQWQASWTAFSGSDQAEGEVWKCVRDFYRAIDAGTAFDTAIAEQDAKWRAYAEQQNAKVNSAPKIRFGPRAGQSGIHHRWVSPDLFQQKVPHLRAMTQAEVRP